VFLALLQEGPPPPPEAGGGYGLFLLETLLILGLVCALAWFVIRFGVRRLYAMPSGPGDRNAPIRVVARLPLEPRRTVYIIEAAGKAYLIGTSEGGPMQTLAELDPTAVAAAVAAAPRQKSFLELLKRR
jgi:flagellar biogenesis protein FliO